MRKEGMMEEDKPTFFMMPGYGHEERERRAGEGERMERGRTSFPF